MLSYDAHREACRAGRESWASRIRLDPVGWRTVFALLLFAILLGGLGCGNDTEAITIPPFLDSQVTLVVNQPYTIKVYLSRAGAEQVVVNAAVEPTYAGAVAISPAQLTYAAGEVSKTAQVLAKASTNGQFAQVTFSVAGTTASRVWEVKVDEQAN